MSNSCQLIIDSIYNTYSLINRIDVEIVCYSIER